MNDGDDGDDGGKKRSSAAYWVVPGSSGWRWGRGVGGTKGFQGGEEAGLEPHEKVVRQGCSPITTSDSSESLSSALPDLWMEVIADKK